MTRALAIQGLVIALLGVAYWRACAPPSLARRAALVASIAYLAGAILIGVMA